MHGMHDTSTVSLISSIKDKSEEKSIRFEFRPAHHRLQNIQQQSRVPPVHDEPSRTHGRETTLPAATSQSRGSSHPHTVVRRIYLAPLPHTPMPCTDAFCAREDKKYGTVTGAKQKAYMTCQTLARLEHSSRFSFLIQSAESPSSSVCTAYPRMDRHQETISISAVRRGNFVCWIWLMLSGREEPSGETKLGQDDHLRDTGARSKPVRRVELADPAH